MTGSVAITIEGMGGGGAQLVVKRLLHGLIGRGFHVHLITFQGPTNDFFDVQKKLFVMCWEEHTDHPIPFLPSSQIFSVF